MSATHPTPPPAAPREVELAIVGMTCSACVNSVTRVLSRVPGASGVTVDLAAARARVAGSANPDNLVAALAKAGYGAKLA